MERVKTLKRQFVSEGALTSSSAEKHVTDPIFKSVPNLYRSDSRTNDETESQIKHFYYEYLFAAETLENIVNEGLFVGSIISKFQWHSGANQVNREMSERVLKLVYGTMKCNNFIKLDLPYIDTLLVKTQFLVFNNQFLNNLGLVKIMLFDLMKNHFDYSAFPGVDYTLPTSSTEKESEYQKYCVDIVSDLEETFKNFQVKLCAAYARLRIERKAGGDSFKEQMENILPPEVKQKEEMAIGMMKTMRINGLKTSKKNLLSEVRALGYLIELCTYDEIPSELYQYLIILILEKKIMLYTKMIILKIF